MKLIDMKTAIGLLSNSVHEDASNGDLVATSSMSEIDQRPPKFLSHSKALHTHPGYNETKVDFR
jgi:hypothetical protein